MPPHEQAAELDVRVFERILEETRAIKSRLYLWGGEPLMHRAFGRILALLEQDRREVTICTNAHRIDRYLHGLCRISSSLDLLIPVEGFEPDHDAIRGKGSFKTVMGQINRLLNLRAEGLFAGKISVHTVIHDGAIGRLYELMEHFERLGIDLVLLCFPWFISELASAEMTAFMRRNFGRLADFGEGPHSWDAFKYRIRPDSIPALTAELSRISARAWTTRIRYQPDIEPDEIEPFVVGDPMSARCATRCPVLGTRADIMPDGKVTACKFFPELRVGDLNKETMKDVWSSESYAKIRQLLGMKLSPVCSKCSALYLHAHSTAVPI
jgi:radical SAM protein with 4Fe4S-binding SPASM domain